MGMSASQARFLSLTARKNNVEYHGQQINQQRTTLSNESANYYSELANMAVPIPPSIDDYTKITYTFEDGAVNNTIISLYPDRKNKGQYVVNYLQSWNDDYAIVPAHSSMVEVNDTQNPSKFSIGSQVLRKAGIAPNASDDEYYKSLSASQRTELLKNEEYLLKMVQEKTGDNGDFYIRYVRNTTTGSYEPYLYAESELTQGQKYNNKNLGSIPCYSLGTTTETREILNKNAFIEQDPSGRYVAISFGERNKVAVQYNNSDEIQEYYDNNPAPQPENYTKTVDIPVTKNNQEEIDGYLATHPEPVQEDYTKTINNPVTKNNQEEIDGYLVTHPEPVQEDYTKIIYNPVTKNNQEEIDGYWTTHPEPVQKDYQKEETYTWEEEVAREDYGMNSIFNEAAYHCYDNAVNGGKDECYRHVLAHLLNLQTDGNGHPTLDEQHFTSTTGVDVVIEKKWITESAIYMGTASEEDDGVNTEKLVPVSQFVTYGIKDGEQGELPVAPDTEQYRDIWGISFDDLDLLSDQYVSLPGATDYQKLVSNYKVNENGDIVKKTIFEKAIDLFEVCNNQDNYFVDDGYGGYSSLNYLRDIMPFIKTFQYDMSHIEKTIETKSDTVLVDDVEAYTIAHDNWINGVPKYTEWTEYEPEEVPDVEAYTIAHNEWINGTPIYREWTEYEQEEVPDVEAYTIAHNNWINGVPEYREWTENEPSTVLDPDAYNEALEIYKNNAPKYKTWDEYEEGEISIKRYMLKTITNTDEEAYNSAMNQYIYDKAIYDHKIEKINSEIKIIQQQDKNLELKLKQLDTEESAIQTEMDAVKKVISKNVESSFKTFNA